MTTFTTTSTAVREYRLMYFFGTWQTSSKIYAETDEEAIFDAESELPKAIYNWPYGVALFEGNRRVKTYRENPDFTPKTI